MIDMRTLHNYAAREHVCRAIPGVKFMYSE